MINNKSKDIINYFFVVILYHGRCCNKSRFHTKVLRANPADVLTNTCNEYGR